MGIKSSLKHRTCFIPHYLSYFHLKFYQKLEKKKSNFPKEQLFQKTKHRSSDNWFFYELSSMRVFWKLAVKSIFTLFFLHSMANMYTVHCSLISHHMTLNRWTTGCLSLPVQHWPDWAAEFKLMRHLHQFHLSPWSWSSKMEVPSASWNPWKANRSELSIQHFYRPRHTPTAKEWSSCFLIWCPVLENKRKKYCSSSLKGSQWDLLKRQITSVGLNLTWPKV